MPAYCALFALYVGVGNTPVMGVDIEAPLFECLRKISPEEQCLF